MRFPHVLGLLAVLAALLLPGCQGGLDLVAEPLWESPIWQANTVQELAYDLREDGKLDFVWPDEIPLDVRAEMERRARLILDTWDGQ